MDKIPVVVVGPFGKKLGWPVIEALLEREDEFNVLAGIMRRRDGRLISQATWLTLESMFSVLGPPVKTYHEKAIVFYAVKADSLLNRLNEAVDHGYTHHVIGTTGLHESAVEYLQETAELKGSIIVLAPNFSEGAWIGAGQCVQLAVYRPDYHAEIIETHHWQKADAPSGTAKMWARAIALARGLNPDKVVKCGRAGDLGVRKPDDIWISSVRGGNIPGNHRAIFFGSNENLYVEHDVKSADLFAQGALRAIRWAAAEDRLPGFYGMPHVLGLSKLIELGLT